VSGWPTIRAVSVTAIGDTTAPLLCLGLLYQHEDTIKGLDKRMNERFKAAKFSRGSANKSIPNLVKEGLIELVERGDKPTLARYRITPAGEAYFLEWLRQTEPKPMVRDVLQCKLEFFQFEEIEGLVVALKEQAIAFGTSADLAHEAMQTDQRIRRERVRRGQPPSYRLALRIAKTKDAAKLGYLMRDRLIEAIEELEEIQETFGSIEGGGDG
jgi:DNA-binding PadR family transcriptional regulator